MGTLKTANHKKKATKKTQTSASRSSKKTAPRAKKEVREPGYITQSDWEHMKRFQTISIPSARGKNVIFCEGDTISILPAGATPGVKLPLNEQWIGKILQMKVELTDPNHWWAKIRWYTGRVDLEKDSQKKIKKGGFASFELILTQRHDLVSSQCFNEVVNVIDYNEGDPSPPDIERYQLFCRYEVNDTTTIIHALEDADVGPKMCVCRATFNPDATRKPIHFCPHPGCRAWFHRRCLEANQDQAPHIGNRHETSPDTNNTFALHELMPCPQLKERKPSKRKAEKCQRAILDLLPKELLDLADCPIVRGIDWDVGYSVTKGSRNNTASFPPAIAGNVSRVVTARRLVYEAVSKGLGSTILEVSELLPENWEDLASITTFEREELLTVTAFACPKCKGAI